MTEPLKDLKESLSSARKPDITHAMRVGFLVYTSRPCEYGGVKYVRGNYRRASGGAPHDVPTRADFERLRDYLRAASSHLAHALTAMEDHLAQDPDLLDVAGMRRAAYAVDTDAAPGCPHGPSYLPHVAPACSSLMMGIEQAIACGLLPKDPGQPWAGEATHVSQTYPSGPGFEAILPICQKRELPPLPVMKVVPTSRGVACFYPAALRYCDGIDEGLPERIVLDDEDFDRVTVECADGAIAQKDALVALFKSDPPQASYVTGPTAVEHEASFHMQQQPDGLDTRFAEIDRAIEERRQAMVAEATPMTNHLSNGVAR